MPFVFLGSFFGVQLGHLIGETAQVCVFGITVAWSIWTTTQKACKMIEKERRGSDDDTHVAMESDCKMQEDEPEEMMMEAAEGGEMAMMEADDEYANVGTTGQELEVIMK